MLRKALPIVVLSLVALIGILGYTAMRPPAAPSGPILALPLPSEADSVAGASTDSASLTVFQIQPGQSTARFVIDEILLGNPNTVVGTTDQVSGQLAVNPNAPSDAQAGTILVDARALATDDDRRNRMLREFILSTNDFEYVSFAPTEISGLPASTTIGTAYPLQISGRLTIKGVTHDVTFDATVTTTSATELRGAASTTIPYADWGISIPQVPSVAGVSDQVRLELNFVATSA